MNIVKAHNLACPLDGMRLESRDKQLVCGKGHTFDVARQGYVNLLPVQHKRSRHPGDSKEMVAARARFLGSGCYAPVANKLAEIAAAQICGDVAACFLDAGCGEGYYLDYVLDSLKHKTGTNELSFIGLDISRAAIAQAAKRNRQITWIVGTNRRPPVEAASVDAIFCVFGYQSFEGFHGILKPGGKVVLVEPGPDHLQELRKIIYPEVRKSGPPDLADAEESGFSLRDRRRLVFRTGLMGHEQLGNLLAMTPHFYRATREGREAAASLQELDVTVDVVFRTLEKT